MAKKTKELGSRNNVNNGDSISGSSIFNKLFGNISEQQTTTSLFSDDNPFRRKALDLSIEENKAGGDENPDSAKLLKKGEKKKKKREIKPSLDSDSDHEELKKKKLKVSVMESKEIDGEDEKEINKRKKRKRDMLEAQYEARKYGTPVVKDEGAKEGQSGEATTGKKRKKVDDPADMMVSKEGFDDEAKLLRTIFVGNLPLKVKKKSLLKEFSQFGEVESVRIRSVPLLSTKLSRKGAVIQNKVNDAIDSVHAYVVFKTEESAQASLAHNMSVVGGNHIRVDRACPPRKKMKGEDAPLYDCKRTIFVGNLPFDAKEEEVYQLFASVKDLEPNIEAIRLIKDSLTSMGKGIAYVLFKNRGAANLVVRKHLKLRGRDLRLSHAKPEATTSSNKRKETTSFESNNSTPTKKMAIYSTPQGKIIPKVAASTSYQGLRASKSGVEKKGNLHNKNAMRKPTPVGEAGRGGNQKERSGKRPAVLARKNKALAKARATEGTSQQAGNNKRKMSNRTPESTQKNKKPRTFR
ncbi:RNA-binding protein 34 [Impatiens glandulifera]|uniref:RNA-binding protein 34 n=1 Tax=Impatiens glandulifera TaxID=253017 RepID=UPI001FB172D5|nr:RNA-binding protein 34 [Impatiens glandulifera]